MLVNYSSLFTNTSQVTTATRMESFDYRPHIYDPHPRPRPQSPGLHGPSCHAARRSGDHTTPLALYPQNRYRQANTRTPHARAPSLVGRNVNCTPSRRSRPCSAQSRAGGALNPTAGEHVWAFVPLASPYALDKRIALRQLNRLNLV